MSTPSSIVGEQYSTGSAALLNSFSRSSPVRRRDLGGVLLGAQPGQGGGDALVEVAEERVDPRAFLVVQRASDAVLGAGQAVAEVPADHGGPQPVARPRLRRRP